MKKLKMILKNFVNDEDFVEVIFIIIFIVLVATGEIGRVINQLAVTLNSLVN